MKKAVSYLYREILLKVNEELNILYESKYDEDKQYQESIKKFRLEFKALNLDDLYNFDEDKCEEFYKDIRWRDFEDILRDVTSEFRNSGEPMNDRIDEGRHYCSREVVKRITGLCRVFLAWTYYFGGGKHSEPESIEWMEDCYLVVEKEEVKIVKIYEKIEK